MKLTYFKEFTGKIILKTGLHIGSGGAEMKIGGTDNPVIKHPHTQEPYIPGSSLKGKVRALLEMRSGLMVKTEGKPVSLKLLQSLKGAGAEEQECEKILKLFGSGASEKTSEIAKEIGTTRVSFADCSLDKDWKKTASDNHWALFEVKSENTINRITGTALNPRTTERVPAGAIFDFSITLKQLEENENFKDFLLKGLKLLSVDSLGGSGSRGYGRIEFKFDDNKIQEEFDKTNPLE